MCSVGPGCNSLVPSQFIYETESVRNADGESSHCNVDTVGDTDYTFCSNSDRLNDNAIGPRLFNYTDPSSYYLWNRSTYRMMFVLPTVSPLLQFIHMYFYVDSRHGIGRPKTRVLLVDETFQINDVISETAPSQVLNIVSGGPDELRNQTLVLNTNAPITNRVLLEVKSSKTLSLAISELKFCAAGNTQIARVHHTIERGRGQGDHNSM